jgi:hypothetical protein
MLQLPSIVTFALYFGQGLQDWLVLISFELTESYSAVSISGVLIGIELLCSVHE